MQTVLDQGSIDKPLTFDVGLIQLSFIPVCLLNTCNISVKLCRGFALQCFSLPKQFRWLPAVTSRKPQGSVQLCAGQASGCEAAIHSVRAGFQDVDAEAALLVDASNAFNFINRMSALLNIRPFDRYHPD